MATFADFAREAARLELSRADAQAQAQRDKAQLWGGTLAQLGQIPLQVMQQRQADRQAKAQEARQARKDALEESRFGLDVAEFQARQAEQQRLAAGKLPDPEIEAALKQANGHYPTAAALLRETNPSKAEQLELDNLETLDKVLKQSNQGNWTAVLPILKRRAPNPDAIPDAFDPKWKEEQLGLKPEAIKTREVKTRNPDGSETIRIVPDAPDQTFTSAAEPVKPSTSNPTEASLAAAAAAGDQNAARALQLLRQQNASQREERLVQIMGPNGTPIWVRESQAVGQPAAQAPRAVTGQERQALAFYNRAKQAVETITEGEPGTTLEDRMAKQSLAAQYQLGSNINVLQTKEQQAYRQAQRAFTEARLRKESGAAIPEGEYKNDARTYFAQPGDAPETVAQKRKSRQTVLDGLKFGAGKAYDEFYGEPNSGGRGTTPNIEEWVRDASGKLVKKVK